MKTEELQKIREALPHGSINKIAKAVGIHRNAVSDVLKGEYFNEKVITEAIKIIDRHNSKQAKLSARANSVLKSN